MGPSGTLVQVLGLFNTFFLGGEGVIWASNRKVPLIIMTKNYEEKNHTVNTEP